MNRLVRRNGAGSLPPAKLPSDKALRSQEASGTEADQAAFRPTMRFHHRPIWDTAANVVISYLCQTSVPVHFPEDCPAIEMNGPEGKQAAIDQGVLQECVASIQAVHKRGFRLVSGVSVALDTISYSRLWRPYWDELQKIPPGVSRDFVFFVNRIDNGVPNIRLVQELPKLSQYARSIFCLLNEQAYIGTRFSRTGTNAIGIELAPGASEAVCMSRVAELARQAASARLGAFVLGIPSTPVMLHAISQGVRYLEGPIIRPPVTEPRHAFAQSLEHIYIQA